MVSGSLQLFVSMCVILVTFSNYGGALPANHLVISERQTSPDSAITLLSIERQPTAQGNRFTVRYTKNVDSLVFTVQDNLNIPREPTVTQEADGVWAASFVVPVVPSVTQWFIMRDADALFMKAIMLNNSESTPGQQTFPELPVIHFDPPREAVYRPGENVTLTLFVPSYGQGGKLIGNLQKMFYGVDLTSMKMYQDLNLEGSFTIGQPERLADRLRVGTTAHTSQHPMSGYLQFSTQVTDTGGPLVKQIQVARSLLLRPAGQSGPYPEDYLAFVDGFMQDVSSRGRELHRCTVGYECLVMCASVGGAVSDIQVREMKPDGSLEAVPSARQAPHSSSTDRAVYWKFLAREDSGDSESITTFQCQATDSRHGLAVSKLVDVMSIIVGSIDPARSNVTEEDHPMDPNLKILTYRCAVRGRPLPEVVFHGVSGQPFDVYEDLPDDVSPTGQNEAVATKVVTVDAYQLSQAIERVKDGQETSPRCEIRPRYEGQVHSYYFY
ncbi:hypothetical protein EGW08_005019 [Elysia chlorotica]|uniref:Alpha-2-macroglobulin bait region domain-containing protein n=1 Tax=Elysia chlorotica TaxID=188477 RepID=A0A3S0ZZX3_ELYCH|nr:hypothetical protein EGW08_005019 [Elysia chlorotica]